MKILRRPASAVSAAVRRFLDENYHPGKHKRRERRVYAGDVLGDSLRALAMPAVKAHRTGGGGALPPPPPWSMPAPVASPSIASVGTAVVASMAGGVSAPVQGSSFPMSVASLPARRLAITDKFNNSFLEPCWTLHNLTAVEGTTGVTLTRVGAGPGYLELSGADFATLCTSAAVLGGNVPGATEVGVFVNGSFDGAGAFSGEVLTTDGVNWFWYEAAGGAALVLHDTGAQAFVAGDEIGLSITAFGAGSLRHLLNTVSFASDAGTLVAGQQRVGIVLRTGGPFTFSSFRSTDDS